VFAPNVPDASIISERFTTEADARRAKRKILTMYPAATVRIEKTDESGEQRKPACGFWKERPVFTCAVLRPLKLLLRKWRKLGTG
jgi:hypothetical protein